MSFLLDSDICSAHTKNDRALFSRLLQHYGQLHVSTITVAELSTWANRALAPSKRKTVIHKLLADVVTLDVIRVIAERFGVLRAGLLDQGQNISIADGLIAATALVHDLTLVTHNTRDFVAIPKLRIADWLESL